MCRCPRRTASSTSVPSRSRPVTSTSPCAGASSPESDDVLCRLHSECLTGDALTSLRCDCGQQLRLALRTIAAEGCGVLIYATGHEGRGIGLVNKLRWYVEQDNGADTVDANVRLGLPVDARDYADAADVLASLGVRSIQLLTNNPRQSRGAAGCRHRGLARSGRCRPLHTLATGTTCAPRRHDSVTYDRPARSSRTSRRGRCRPPSTSAR